MHQPAGRAGFAQRNAPGACSASASLKANGTLHCRFNAALFLGGADGWGALRRVTPPALLLPLWVAYAWVMGTVATGVWVVAHECGHGAFSESSVRASLSSRLTRRARSQQTWRQSLPARLMRS